MSRAFFARAPGRMWYSPNTAGRNRQRKLTELNVINVVTPFGP